jgi:hypothetical protein
MQTIVLLLAAVLTPIVVLVLAWPRSPEYRPPRSASPHGHASSTPPPTNGAGRTSPTIRATSTTVAATTIPATSIPNSPSLPITPVVVSGTSPPAKPGSALAATTAEKADIDGGVHAPGPIGDVFLSGSDSSYAVVEFGGSQPGFMLMQNQAGTWTEVAEGSPQFPCQDGLPIQVKSDFSGFMAPCG